MTKKSKPLGSGKTGSKPIVMTVGAQISEADRALFTEDELKAMEAEVVIEASDEMREEARDRVRATLKAQKRAEMKRHLDPNEEMFFLTVDLAPYADRIMLDNVIYLHGITYEVPKSTADTMMEIMARSWEHESSRGNPNANFYLKPRQTRIGPRDAGVDASALLMRV